MRRSHGGFTAYRENTIIPFSRTGEEARAYIGVLAHGRGRPRLHRFSRTGEDARAYIGSEFSTICSIKVYGSRRCSAISAA